LDDLVRALLFLAERTDCFGVYNATAPEPVTMNELARAIGHAIHRPTLFRVPSFALKVTMGEGRADALLTGQRAIPKRLTDAGFEFRFRTIESALTEILR
jgi:NAD dependent epimerase/dehydratase family enzyme